MGIVIGDEHADKYDRGVNVVMAHNAMVSETSRGDFPLREVTTTGRGEIIEFYAKRRKLSLCTWICRIV
jgi:hypothetical protein